MNIINNYSTSIVTIFQSVIKDYEYDVDEIRRIEAELQDLYHEAELSKPKDMYQGYLLYKNIRELRIRRRELKEEVELLREIYDYFKSQPAQSFKNKIQQIQGNATKLRRNQESRTYVPRQRTDLTIANHHSMEARPFEEMLAEFNQTKIRTEHGKLRK
jgi:hypothetical protein